MNQMLHIPLSHRASDTIDCGLRALFRTVRLYSSQLIQSPTELVFRDMSKFIEATAESSCISNCNTIYGTRNHCTEHDFI